MSEKSILMVCLGNICRSPLAEGLMQYHCKSEGLSWEVDSAGTSAYHVGEGPDRRSVDVARNHGVDISGQRARQFRAEDFSSFDHILVMDSSNYNDVVALAPSDRHKERVELLLNYSEPGQNRAVPDPYYEGGFDKVYEMIDQAVRAFISKHKE